MKKGEIYEGIIESIDFPNKGNVWVDAGDGAEPVHVIVKNGIPGQKIRFQIHKKRKNRCEGRLLEVLERSPQENGIRSAINSQPAAAVCTRPWIMKISLP